MTTANEKVRSLFLAALMVFSVFGATVAFSGGAAAANDPANLQFSANAGGGSNLDLVASESTTTDITFDVDNLNDASSGQTVNFNVSAEDGVEFSSLNSVQTGPSVSSSASVDSNGDIVFALQPSSQNTDATVTLEGVTVQAPAQDGDYNLNVDVNDTGGQDASTEFQNAFTVGQGSSQTGFLSGRVSDQNNDDVPNATVTAVRNSDGLTKTTETNSEGDYTIELQPGTYNVTVEREGFSTAEATNQEVNANKTTTANLVIRRLLLPRTIDATPEDGEDIVGETVQFNAIVRDQDGNPLSDTDVTVEADQPVTFTSTGTNTTSQTTDENGEFTVNTTSDTIVSGADVTFTVDSNESVNDTVAVSFTQSGEAEISGAILNQQTTNPLANASVWAVRSGQYEANEYRNAIDLSDFETNDDDTVYIRLIDNETGAVIDNDEYDLRVANYSDLSGAPTALAEDGTAVRKIEELNESDQRVGSGYALIDANDDGYIAFNHTRVENREYYAQVSLDAENASDDRITDDIGSESFVNVTGVQADGVTANVVGTPFVFAPSANLTLENTIDRAQTSDANQVDSPGFVNSYGQDTGGSSLAGIWGLNRLSSDYQQGQNYVIIATKTGFETEFKDVYATEAGELTFEQAGNSNDIQLLPEEVDPDSVNITQIGTRETFESDTVEFDNKTDEFAQRVPRDGETVDVFQVDTAAGDTPVNATVDLTFEDENVTGEFVNIAGGEFVSQDDANNTATIYTGADGTAQVWYETDTGNSDILTNKTAVLTNDASASDNSTVLFLGTINFDTGSVSGIVTNEDNEPIVNSVVYAEEFESQNGTTFLIEPTEDIESTSREEVRNTEFTLTDNSSGDNVTVTGAELEEFDFEGNFSRVSVDGVETTTLLTFPAEDDGEAQYTLPRVPAQDPTGVSYERVAGIELDSGQQGVGDTDSPVQIDFTQEANVVIRGADPLETAQFDVSDLSAPASAEAGEEFDVSATITNDGVISDTQEVQFRVGSGSLTSSTVAATQNVTLAPGENTTVTFSDLSVGADGEYNHGVFTDTDSATATIDIGDVEGDDGELSPVAQQYDANDDGEISAEELGTAGEDFAQGNLSAEDLGTVGEAFASN